MKENLLKELTFKFSIKIISVSRLLQESKKEWVLSKQILRSGTSIGAMIREAEFAQSKVDFISKMSIALKEANESSY
jgi:four helix bundle protein